MESNLSHLKSIYQLMKESFELNESENEKFENLLSHIEIRTLQLRKIFLLNSRHMIWSISNDHHMKNS